MEPVLLIGALSIVAASLIYALLAYLFHRPSLKDYDHPYKEPGYVYRIKWLLISLRELLVSKKSQCRFNSFELTSSDTKKMGIHPSVGQDKLESPQNPQSSIDMDEISFMGVNPRTGNVINVSLAQRNGDKCEAVIHFVVNEDGQRKEYELPHLPRTLSRNKQEDGRSWTCDDLKISNLRSLARWKISFNGLLREKTSNEISYVVFSFVWSAYSRAIDHKTSVSRAVKIRTCALSDANDIEEDMENILDQYDQWGTFRGSYMLDDGPETEMLLFGGKMRRIGKLSLSDIHRFIQIKGYVEDGTTFSFNAINIPHKIPEMVWGYVELSSGFRHILTSSDFDLLRFKEMESSPKVLSTRFKADGDEYILDLSCENGNFTHLWGPEEEVKANCNNITLCLTSVYHGLRLKGSGLISFMSKNDLELEPQKKLPPLLTEPDVTCAKTAAKNILVFSEEYCKSSKLVGGKGSSLAMLKQIKGNFQVPDGLCITVSAYDKHIQENMKLKEKIGRISQICCGKIKSNIEEECKSLGKLFEEAEISEALIEELRQKLVELYGDKFEEISFGVRSSAIGEDGEEMSAAGQMETILGCKGLNQVLKGVKKCWASCFGFRAVEYRRQNGQLIDVGMGVVVQQMVSADKAGVLFTRDPVNGNPAVISIAANYGIGESVVSAMSEPDTIVVTRTFDNQLTLSQITIGKKQLQIRMKEDGSVEETEISQEDTKSCCLSTTEAMELAELGVLVEQCYGNPRDMEWAIHKGQIYLLQARPITNLHNESEYLLKNEFNSACYHDSECTTSGNFKEVLPGAASPLSNSCVYPLLNIVLLEMGFAFGIDKPLNFVYNPTFKMSQNHTFNRRATMMYSNNVKFKGRALKTLQRMKKSNDVAFNGRLIDDGDLEKQSIVQYRYGSIYQLLKQVILSTLMNSNAKEKLSAAQKKYLQFKMSVDHCKTNEEIVDFLRYNFKPYNETMLAHGGITFTSSKYNGDILLALLGDETDYNETHYGDFALLLSIQSGDEVESADVPTALQNLAKCIVENSDSQKFIQMSKEDGEKFLTSEDSLVKRNYDDFIKKHGHRCVKEFDISSKTWSMEPSKLVAPLQAIIRTSNKFESKKLTVDEAISGLQTNLSEKQKKSLRKLVLKAREFVGLREEAKSLLIRTIDQYRQQWRKLGRKLYEEGRVPDDDLIFFMTTEEIIELLRTRSAKIIQRAVKRRRLHPKLERLRFPEINFGAPKPISDKVKALDKVDGCLVLKGTPVSRGIIEAPAKVVLHVEDAHTIEPGDILITNATDIAWSPYFPSLSGVITEIGGLISHGAVVAREYGIPCVVGAANATVHLKSGDRIQLNGNTGQITVLST